MSTGDAIAVILSIASIIGMIATFIFAMRRDRREADTDHTKHCATLHAPLHASQERLEGRVDSLGTKLQLHDSDISRIRLSTMEIQINLKHFMTSQSIPYHQITEDSK